MTEPAPFLIFQQPPRAFLRDFNRSIQASEQPSSIPRTFLDAMSVREQVFVNELKAVPLLHHTDVGDARCCHWVLYLPSSVPVQTSKPIGTVRLSSGPHPLHPLPGSNFEVPPDESVPSQNVDDFSLAPDLPYQVDRKTDFHDGKEAYVKLQRLCLVKEARGKRLGDLLIQGVLAWARENAELVSRMGGREWNGLVCVHAMEGAGLRTWERNGFTVDNGMGEFYEAGIRHFGMWLRLDLGA